jgi:hypothetical protein
VFNLFVNIFVLRRENKRYKTKISTKYMVDLYVQAVTLIFS